MVHSDAQALDIKFHACPLKDAWLAAGLGPDEVATLCRIASRVDFGDASRAPASALPPIPGSPATRAAAACTSGRGNPSACFSPNVGWVKQTEVLVGLRSRQLGLLGHKALNHD